MQRKTKALGIVLIAVTATALVFLLRPFIDRQAVPTNPASLAVSQLAADETEAIRKYIENEASPIDGFIALHGEKVLMEYGEVDTPMNLASARKSVLSLLVGIASDRNLINLEQTLSELGIDESRTPLTDKEKRATVRDLLQSRSGIYLHSGAETVENRDGRPGRGQFAPGEHYFYNNWDFNVLGAIFEKKTGLTIGEALDLWLSAPLGMQDFSQHHVLYDHGGSESDFRTYRIHMSARDLARLGVLVAQDGMWNQKRIISAAWIERSTSAHSTVKSPFYDGFGYSWWLNSKLGTVNADGWGGQYLLVDRKRDLTLVTRRDTGNSILGYLVFSTLKKQGHPEDIQKLYTRIRQLPL
jgi:CubicO group peptidase (beta-lactamase class C family)